MIMALLAIILTLILVIGIHELGHALVARLFRIKISKISIGFGKPLIKWQTQSGCEWVWAMWPLGGYVQLLNSRISPVDPKENPYCFDKKPVWIRILILLSGAIANLITAWTALVLVFYIGINYKLPQIQSIKPDSLAAKAGVHAGDRWVAIEGYPTSSWQEVGMQLVIHWGQEDVEIVFRQPDKELKKTNLNLSQIQFTSKDGSLLDSIGIKPDLSARSVLKRYPSVFESMQKAFLEIAHIFYFFIMILKQLFTGVIPFSILLGPLAIFSASIASLSQGIIVFLLFIATLSLAVALVNLFPVPGLDGGSILYSLIEKIRGKPVSVALEILLHRLMVIVFCVLLVHLLMNDLNRYLS
ncbi:peptidase [Legionella norrlandica]|uniref:Peptidase n=1 Tax=Legionella norrlandica TaxID=1498499 RepID=A0A0A2SUI3_9GAMM|nr:site-2 protease family protein [Legionella norrlandica]KGP63109.1 peptidase [Legionella norrlandica]